MAKKFEINKASTDKIMAQPDVRKIEKFQELKILKLQDLKTRLENVMI